MNFLRFFITIFLGIAPLFSASIDFDVLEGKGSHFWKKLSDADKRELEFYKANYSKQIDFLGKKESEHPRIPRILHWIWVGPKPFPSESVELVRGWMEKHPDWKFLFWTELQDRPTPVEGMEKHLIQELSFSPLYSFISKTENYGEKSDIVRYILLFEQGGVYVDHDVFCFQSFEDLIYPYDFFSALEPPHRNMGFQTRVFSCNAVIGTVPGHPIFQKAMEEVQLRWEAVGRRYPGKDSKNSFARVLNRTLASFACAVRQRLNAEGARDIVLPAAFFFPDRLFNAKEITELQEQKRVFASHRFAASWFDPIPAEKNAEDMLVAKLKNQRRKLHKKIALLEKLLFLNASLSGIGIILLFRRRRKVA